MKKIKSILRLKKVWIPSLILGLSFGTIFGVGVVFIIQRNI